MQNLPICLNLVTDMWATEGQGEINKNNRDNMIQAKSQMQRDMRARNVLSVLDANSESIQGGSIGAGKNWLDKSGWLRIDAARCRSRRRGSEHGSYRGQ